MPNVKTPASPKPNSRGVCLATTELPRELADKVDAFAKYKDWSRAKVSADSPTQPGSPRSGFRRPNERRRRDRIQKVDAKCDIILRKLAELSPKRKPPAQTGFAAETGSSLRAVQRKCAAGEIRVVGGRIPASELDKFLS